MSRAFVKEDAGYEPEPDYRLPEPDSPYFEEAAAWALIQGADTGNTLGAESATGFQWGEPRLIPCMEKIRDEARMQGNDRVEQLARRFIAAASRR